MHSDVLIRCALVPALIAWAVFGASPARASVIWDEAINGDLSGDHLNPTALVLGLGTSSLIATSSEDPEAGTIDREFFSTMVPDGLLLSELRLTAYSGLDEIAFIGVVSGPVFSVDPDDPVIEDLLGWSHFGPLVQPVGTDYLPRIGSGFLAIGFTPPLPSGAYSWWTQQLGPATTYQWDFVVTPEPGTFAVLFIAGIAFLRRR